MVLPKYVAFQSMRTEKYLQYRHEEGNLRGYLQCSGDEVLSPYTKYEIERAKSHGNLVHLRCCYSNKYWAKLSSADNWIVALANEPVDDQAQWACTLFQPIFDPNHQAYRFRHVHNGNDVVVWTDDFPTNRCLLAQYNEPYERLSDLFTIIDFQSLLVLPKYVAFKGDNGLYLCAAYQEGHQYLEFSGKDIGDPKVENEVFVDRDGSIRIKSYHYEKFWRRTPDCWIWADSTDARSSDRDTLFCAVKLDGNTIALRNLGNGCYCKGVTKECKENCLYAEFPTISNEAKLQVEELVLLREIYDVEFRASDARIFGQSVESVVSDTVTNDLPFESTLDVGLSFTDEITKNWSSTVTVKLGVKTTINTGIPVIADGQVEVSGEFSAAYTWGEAVKSEKKISHTWKVPVPANKTVKVTMIATKGRCNVPFSYTQRDTMMNGKHVLTRMDDGIFTVANSYSFTYKAELVD